MLPKPFYLKAGFTVREEEGGFLIFEKHIEASEKDGWLRSFCQIMRKHLPVELAGAVLSGWADQTEKNMVELGRWLIGVMERFDNAVVVADRAKIMNEMGRECAEMNRTDHIDPEIAKRMKFASLDEYLINQEASEHKGYQIIREGQVIRVHYAPRTMNTRCYCHVWSGLPGNVDASGSWCLCSRGFIEVLWEGILGAKPRVDLLCSAVSGAEVCIFEVHIPEVIEPIA